MNRLPTKTDVREELLTYSGIRYEGRVKVRTVLLTFAPRGNSPPVCNEIIERLPI